MSDAGGKIRLAMPIAHQTAGTYGAWYNNTGAPMVAVDRFFDRTDGKGMWFRRNPGITAYTANLFNLYAMSDGFLTWRDVGDEADPDKALCLRLATEFKATAVAKYCSAAAQQAFRPDSPQLRHVVYAFRDADSDPFDSFIKPQLLTLLANNTHPARTLMTVKSGSQAVPFSTYIANTANLNAWIAGFKAGTEQLFVQAGDLIGNFVDNDMEICLCDSCGGWGDEALKPPLGREINPSFYLYTGFGTAAQTDTHATVLTAIDTNAVPDLDPVHPLVFAYRPFAPITSATNEDQFLDYHATTSPRPTLVTVNCWNVALHDLADQAVALGPLAKWHKSRNASSGEESKAPIEWRYRGEDAEDVLPALYGRLVTRFAGEEGGDGLPGGGTAFDFDLEPPAIGQHVVAVDIWNAYCPLFNAAAKAFQVPCELLVSIFCAESGDVFPAGQDADVVRLPPLGSLVLVAPPTERAAYAALAGTTGATAFMPRPWSPNAFVIGTSGLTWAMLQDLVTIDPEVKVRIGATGLTAPHAYDDLEWARRLYGTTFLTAISATVPGGSGPVTLHVTEPHVANSAVAWPQLFAAWLGITVNAAGVVTTTAVDGGLTRYQRVFHAIVACAARVKRNANSVRAHNMVTDFDAPTVFSAYADSGKLLMGEELATSTSSDDEKWRTLFGMSQRDGAYAKTGVFAYNLLVDHFNTLDKVTAPATVLPAVRIWRDS